MLLYNVNYGFSNTNNDFSSIIPSTIQRVKFPILSKSDYESITPYISNSNTNIITQYDRDVQTITSVFTSLLSLDLFNKSNRTFLSLSSDIVGSTAYDKNLKNLFGDYNNYVLDSTYSYIYMWCDNSDYYGVATFTGSSITIRKKTDNTTNFYTIIKENILCRFVRSSAKPRLYFLIDINDDKSAYKHMAVNYNSASNGSIFASLDDEQLNAVLQFLGNEQGEEPGEEDTDPYSRGGNSGGGGGTGDFDGTSDTIGLPSLPSLSGLNTGFFTAFVPSASQMQSVSNYLWNNALTDILDPNTGLGEKVDALKKIVANPYDAIMGCSIIPVTPPTAGSKELKMYGILETGISLPYASTRWVQVDCGTLNIHEFWGSYLDYSPYTKTTSLYLPYIGTVSIDIDLIMAKSLQVVYYVDILSGICVAFILVDGSVKFHYQGQCSTQVPITNADYSSIISAGIGLIGNASQVVGSAVTGGVGGGVGGAVAGAVSGAISQAPAIASNVMSAKPDIRSGGAIGSSAGILSVQRPYLIIERPKQSVPAFQNHFTGYPSNITAKVGDLTGYTEFETINLDGIALTDAEKAELETLLKGGVYL